MTNPRGIITVPGATVTVPGFGQCKVLYPLTHDRGGYRVRQMWTGFEFSATL